MLTLVVVNPYHVEAVIRFKPNVGWIVRTGVGRASLHGLLEAVGLSIDWQHTQEHPFRRMLSNVEASHHVPAIRKAQNGENYQEK